MNFGGVSCINTLKEEKKTFGHILFADSKHLSVVRIINRNTNIPGVHLLKQRFLFQNLTIVSRS